MRPATERRSFYRINDTVGLSYTLLDGRERQPQWNLQSLAMPVTSLLDEIDREFNQAANILWQENPTAGRALGLLNRKLSIIAAHTLHGEDDEPGPYEELMVNISGSGIGFDCPESFPEGARLLLNLVLKPSNVTLSISGVVIGSEPGSDPAANAHWTRVSFDEGNEAAQEQLIQHIVQRQSVLLQERD